MPRHRRKSSTRARRKQAAPLDEQGQRLEAARTAFRTEWQAKVDRKRRQAARRRGIADVIRNGIHKDPRRPFIVGGCLGAAILGGTFLGHRTWPDLPFWILIGFLVGYISAMSLLPGALLVAKLCDRWAEQDEQSAKLLEQRRRGRSG